MNARAKDKEIDFPNSNITAFVYSFKRKRQNDYLVNLDFKHYQKICLYKTFQEANRLYFSIDADTCESIDEDPIQDLHLQAAFKAFSMCMN